MDVTIIRKVAEIKAILAVRQKMAESITFEAKMSGKGVLRRHVGQIAFANELKMLDAWREVRQSKDKQKKLLGKWSKYLTENEWRVLTPVYEKP